MSEKEKAFLAAMGPLAAEAPAHILRTRCSGDLDAYFAQTREVLSQLHPRPVAAVLAMRKALAVALVMEADKLSVEQYRNVVAVICEMEQMLDWHPPAESRPTDPGATRHSQLN